jgi:hypothetical protein
VGRLHFVVTPTERQAAQFLGGETYATMHAESVGDFQTASVNLRRSAKTLQGLIDIGSGCRPYKGIILPAKIEIIGMLVLPLILECPIALGRKYNELNGMVYVILLLAVFRLPPIGIHSARCAVPS